MIVGVNSQHRYQNRNYRPANDEYADAKRIAEAAGVNMNVLVRALLRLLRADTARVLRLLRPHLAAIIAETPKGRPARDLDEPGNGNPRVPS